MDGRRTRWRRLLRADKLDHIAPASQMALQEYGVRSIIDLRYSREVLESPDVIAQSDQFTYVHMPLYELAGLDMLPVIPHDAGELYRLIIDHRQKPIRRIIEMLVSSRPQPTLIHCTAGKDRTGIIIALVLGAVGVPAETIVDEYMLSKERLAPLLDLLRDQAKENGWDAEWYDRLLACQSEFMRDMLDHIDRQYGGIVSYLQQAGVTSLQIERLRSWLLE